MARESDALRLRLMLEVHGLTQVEVARATGVSPAAVSKWLAGSRRPTARAQAAIVGLIASRPLLGAGL